VRKKRCIWQILGFPSKTIFIKAALFALLFIFCFSISFPLLIPGTKTPVLIHTILGKYAAFFIFPFFTNFLTVSEYTPSKHISDDALTLPKS